MPIQPSNRLKAQPAYAFKAIDDKVAELKRAGVVPIDFGVGDPSEPPPNFVIDKLTESGYQNATSGYPSYAGSEAFRIAAASYMKRRFGVELNPTTEICSNIGSKEAIFNFPEAFINPGDTVIIPSPAYPPMKSGTAFAEGVPYFVPLLEKNKFLIDYTSIPSEIAQKAKIMWINYPNSPTGAVANLDYYQGLIEWAHAKDIIIAADEGCYIDIYFGDKPPSILEIERKGILVFYSLSKRNNMTGYRVGFVAGDSKLIDVFKQLKTNIDSGTPNFIQDAAIAALNDDAHVAQMRAIYRQKGDILLNALSEIGFVVKQPSATFYIWQKLPDGMNDLEFAERLLDYQIGIVVTPGSLLSEICDVTIDGQQHKLNPGAGYLRFALTPTLSEIETVAKRLLNIR